MKKYICLSCGYVYDEEIGDPDHGISPETQWDDIPEDWGCPFCGQDKSSFALYDEN